MSDLIIVLGGIFLTLGLLGLLAYPSVWCVHRDRKELFHEEGD